MLNNYQIKASLEALNFILHQSAWTIECENEKIKKHVTENMERIWTQLNAALAQAHWAGFSPNILQWENDTGDKTIQLAKVKDLIPESATVNWKEVEGGHLPVRSSRSITSTTGFVSSVPGGPSRRRTVSGIRSG